ncbi:AbrB/MazE/SpoVT family DNA-binding domain-containing protein [Candidatus Poribacteria bacterium]|nr:AbrB/MazE/SpoVT family DNA-binding domain-containing protein [Candidatus Poribacteria bacterium]
METNIATVTAKGQITIPKAIRQALGIQQKDRFLFVVEGEQMVVKPLRHRPLGELAHCQPLNRIPAMRQSAKPSSGNSENV